MQNKTPKMIKTTYIEECDNEMKFTSALSSKLCRVIIVDKLETETNFLRGNVLSKVLNNYFGID